MPLLQCRHGRRKQAGCIRAWQQARPRATHNPAAIGDAPVRLPRLVVRGVVLGLQSGGASRKGRQRGSGCGGSDGWRPIQRPPLQYTRDLLVPVVLLANTDGLSGRCGGDAAGGRPCPSRASHAIQMIYPSQVHGRAAPIAPHDGRSLVFTCLGHGCH